MNKKNEEKKEADEKHQVQQHFVLVLLEKIPIVFYKYTAFIALCSFVVLVVVLVVAIIKGEKVLVAGYEFGRHRDEFKYPKYSIILMHPEGSCPQGWTETSDYNNKFLMISAEEEMVFGGTVFSKLSQKASVDFGRTQARATLKPEKYTSETHPPQQLSTLGISGTDEKGARKIAGKTDNFLTLPPFATVRLCIKN